MITFKKYLLEYAMGEKALSKATSVKAKVGYEFELIFPLDHYIDLDKDETGRLHLDDLDDYYDLNKHFYISGSDSRKIFRDMDNWLDEQEDEYVKDHYEDYLDDDTDEDLAKDKAKDDFKRDDYNIDDFIKAEYTAHSGRRVAIDWAKFIDNYGLNPKFDWVPDEANTFYTEEPSTKKEYKVLKVQSDIATDFARYMGIKNVRASDTYHEFNKSDNWVVEIDTSIETVENKEHGCEIVSPPLDIIEGLDIFGRAFKTFKKMGATTNSSTGLHVNISLEGKPEIDFLKLVLLMGEQNELKKYSREMNAMTKSHLKNIITTSKRYMAMMDSDMDVKDIKDIIHSFSTRMLHEKYASVNFHTYADKGYVEFRVPGGDYLSMNQSEIIKTIKRFVVVLSAAATPEEAKQDYYKKVYKVLDNIIHGETTDAKYKDATEKVFEEFPLLKTLVKKIPPLKPEIERLRDDSYVNIYNIIAVILKLLYNYLKNIKYSPDIKLSTELKRFLKKHKANDLNELQSYLKNGQEVFKYLRINN